VPLVTIKRTYPPVPGVTQYSVVAGDQVVGYVERRRGGWWRAYDAAGRSRGSWFSTRREAVEAL
jgi:hypothetical protein